MGTSVIATAIFIRLIQKSVNKQSIVSQAEITGCHGVPKDLPDKIKSMVIGINNHFVPNHTSGNFFCASSSRYCHRLLFSARSSKSINLEKKDFIFAE
jgi:hypothetical protein